MILPFSTTETPLLAETGSKAKALIETTQAGFQVPDGFVLCTSFFDPWTTQLKMSNDWKYFLSDPVKENCDRLKKAAESFSLTKNQRKDLSASIQKMKASCYAVRSSSPEEDLADISFAGMYTTCLGVSEAELESSIAKVFASMFDFRIIEYKRIHLLDPAATKIAVIVQKQVLSDVSGIAFSINPQNNCYDEVMINASFGLGEKIVSGQVTPDLYVVDVIRKQIIQKELNDKKDALFSSENGRLVNKLNENNLLPALSDEQIFATADLVKRVESEYGYPVDVEWAIENEKLYLLQARPVTAYFPLYESYQTEPGQTKNLYLDVIKLTQGFDWSMSELGAEIFMKMVEKAKQGVMPAGRDGIIYSVHGRIYLLINHMVRAYGKAILPKTIGSYDRPTRSILENFSFEGYIPRKRPAKTNRMVINSLQLILRSFIPVFRAGRDIHFAANAFANSAENAMLELEQLKESNLVFSEQVDFAIRTFDKIVFAFMPFLLSTIAENSLRRLFKNQGMEAEIAMMNMDLTGNPTAEMGEMQMRLAASPEFIACQDSEEFQRKIKNQSFSQDFQRLFQEYMKRFGCRCIGEIDVASVRPYENLADFYLILKQINTEDNALQNMRDKKQKAFQQLLEKAKSLGKEKQFLVLHERLQYLGFREYPKYVFVAAVDVLRKNILRLADRFVAEGRLKNQEDIFLVDVQQVSKAQEDRTFDLIPIAEENRRARSLTANVKYWPALVDSRGKIFTAKRQSQAGELVGDPISPGVVRGRAKVLHFPFEKMLSSGEILVTKATEPSWTPIFMNSAAIVMEVGGLLQHGAIIAREYGIPCVSGIDRITAILKDGDLIEVDGTNGIVRICEPDETTTISALNHEEPSH